MLELLAILFALPIVGLIVWPLWRAQARVAAVLVAVVLLGGGAGLYNLLGSPTLPPAPYEPRLQALRAQPPEALTLGEVIHIMEAEIRARPEDGVGWRHLGTLYTMAGAYDHGVHALGRAVSLGQSDADTLSRLGEALVLEAGGQVTPRARAVFEAVLEQAPATPRARYYAALDLEQQGEGDAAASAYGALVADLPPESPWAGQAATRRAALTPGPDSAAVEAAAALSPEDRLAMVEGMVAGLADRLEADPMDPAGWARLLRSYLVLGREADARAALAQARNALSGSPDQLREVEAAARGLGLATQ